MALIPIATGGGIGPRAWRWVSPEYTMDSPTQVKRFYGVRVKISGSLSGAEYSTDGGSSWSSLALDGNGLSTAPATGSTFKTFRLRLTGNTGAAVYTVSIMFRRMVGQR